MPEDTFILELGSTRVVVADPRAATPYYRGTRFDRTGIILSLEAGGHRYVQPWQRHYDPWSHDAVSGPAEEFLPVFPDAGATPVCGVTQPQRSEDGRSRNRGRPGGIVKIGVGLLRNDGEPYDRFKLYEILDPGETTVEPGAAGPKPACVTFRQQLTGCYDYVKTVEIPADGRLRLTHDLRNDSPAPIDTYVYCHNFFILDGAPTGRATRFEFPFRPVGDWRAPYDSVRLTDRGITFDRDLRPDETVFMGNLRPERGTTFPEGAPVDAVGYRFTLRNLENSLSVEAACDRPMEYAVFWSNPDVSCLEPYLPLHLNPGQTARWTLDYHFLSGA